MDEILRDIEGFEGLYMVSDQGNVYSLNYNHTEGLKSLKGGNRKKYKLVTLVKNKKNYTRQIHRLVAKTFPEICGEWFEGCQINHKDENPGNNKAENLEVCTAKHNANWGNRKDKISKAKSKPVARYENGKLMGIFINAQIAALMTGANYGHISACCHGKRKTHHGSRWAFIDLQL